MSTDREFINKFNELDQICQKLYPNQKKGFNAIRTFGTYALNPSDKKTLDNLIDARNTYSHDKNNLIHFDQRAINFVQGLIDGANRRFYNNAKGRIDSDLENLRTKNLAKMSSLLKSFDYTYKILDNSAKSKFKNRLKQYIESERSASGLENIKKYYFDFTNYFKEIKTSDEYSSAVNEIRSKKRARYENNLSREKEKAENSAINAFDNYINNLGAFHFSQKKKAKEAKQRFISLIRNARNFDDLEDVIDDIDCYFDYDDDDDD